MYRKILEAKFLRFVFGASSSILTYFIKFKGKGIEGNKFSFIFKLISSWKLLFCWMTLLDPPTYFYRVELGILGILGKDSQGAWATAFMDTQRCCPILLSQPNHGVNPDGRTPVYMLSSSSSTNCAIAQPLQYWNVGWGHLSPFFLPEWVDLPVLFPAVIHPLRPEVHLGGGYGGPLGGWCNC